MPLTHVCILLLKRVFVDKVNSPFAPNMELLGSDEKMLCLPCLKIDLSV